MKMLIPVLILFSSFNLMAGYEDHVQAQACYTLTGADAGNVNLHLPFQICLESVSVDLNKNQVEIYSYFQPELYLGLKTETLVRQTEDTYKFLATNEIYRNDGIACDFAENLKLVISGQTDFNGLGDIHAVDIQVERETTSDICHSYPEVEVFQYKKQN